MIFGNDMLSNDTKNTKNLGNKRSHTYGFDLGMINMD